jgi:hypothetical protein
MTVPVDAVPARFEDTERRLSPAEVEAVLGRAIELHVREVAGASAAEIPESELLRIGRELGLAPDRLRRALAEVDGGLRAEETWLSRNLGEPRAGASRLVSRGAADVQRELESYLVETECMVVERRYPGRTVYVPAAGVLAAAARAARRLRGRHRLLGAEHLEVAVQALAESSCCVAVTVDLSHKRREVAATATAGAGTGAVAALLAGTFVAPPAALLGVPILAAALLGSRSAYRNAFGETSGRVESVLDRLEHSELESGPTLRAMLGV